MRPVLVCLFSVVVIVESGIYDNVTYPPANRQLLDFKLGHPISELWTNSFGEPTDIRSIRTINTPTQFDNMVFLDAQMTFDGQKIPERIVHAKGGGAFGYFEVTHDVSKYTYADVFNGIGKRTPLVVRFSPFIQNQGGSDLSRGPKGIAIKFYTREGNLDFACLQIPVYLYNEPELFATVTAGLKRNAQTGLLDYTARWDLITLLPMTLLNFFYQFSDYGIPNGYRRMDAFAIHTYQIINKAGQTHYVKFNFRSEQGFLALNSSQAEAIQGEDLDYFNRDLYNAIAQGNFPAWRLEMDIMTPSDIQTVDFNPFDVTRLWKKGTFFTVQIGRLVLNKNVENQFRDLEELAINPGRLIPGIPGPVDFLFKSRKIFYRDTQNHRLGRNVNNILVNKPLYSEGYDRNGKAPTGRNGANAPNYYPNSFNGPMPYVDEKRPNETLLVYIRNAMDLEPMSNFYKYMLEDDAHRQRFINNIATTLAPVIPSIVKRAMKLLSLVDKDLGKRVRLSYKEILQKQMARQAAEIGFMSPLTYTPSAEPAFNEVDQKFFDYNSEAGDQSIFH